MQVYTSPKCKITPDRPRWWATSTLLIGEENSLEFLIGPHFAPLTPRVITLIASPSAFTIILSSTIYNNPVTFLVQKSVFVFPFWPVVNSRIEWFSAKMVKNLTLRTAPCVIMRWMTWEFIARLVTNRTTRRREFCRCRCRCCRWCRWCRWCKIFIFAFLLVYPWLLNFVVFILAFVSISEVLCLYLLANNSLFYLCLHSSIDRSLYSRSIHWSKITLFVLSPALRAFIRPATARSHKSLCHFIEKGFVNAYRRISD